ncbi:MAG: sigma-70 family RNA polymerase sigma factor [Acidobacteriota bacterium]|nr:sigma-70 family RNA polymerase sigma factor [Acidobacteriota bacterium]
MARVASSPAPIELDATVYADAERMYRDYRRLLFSIAVRKFNVPVSDAETLVQEAWLAFLTQDVRIHDPKAWLAATMRNLSRHYWRQRARIQRVEVSIDAAEEVADLGADRMEHTLVIQQVLSLLTLRDRDILRLHYFERLTASAIAEHFDTTTGYAEKRIYIALKRAREIHARLLARGHGGIRTAVPREDGR